MELCCFPSTDEKKKISCSSCIEGQIEKREGKQPFRKQHFNLEKLTVISIFGLHFFRLCCDGVIESAISPLRQLNGVRISWHDFLVTNVKLPGTSAPFSHISDQMKPRGHRRGNPSSEPQKCHLFKLNLSTGRSQVEGRECFSSSWAWSEDSCAATSTSAFTSGRLCGPAAGSSLSPLLAAGWQMSAGCTAWLLVWSGALCAITIEGHLEFVFRNYFFKKRIAKFVSRRSLEIQSCRDDK